MSQATRRVRMLSTQVERAPLGVLGEGQEYDIPEELARRWAALGLATIVQARPVASPLQRADAERGEHVVEEQLEHPAEQPAQRSVDQPARRRGKR